MSPSVVRCWEPGASVVQMRLIKGSPSPRPSSLEPGRPEAKVGGTEPGQPQQEGGLTSPDRGREEPCGARKAQNAG